VNGKTLEQCKAICRGAGDDCTAGGFSFNPRFVINPLFKNHHSTQCRLSGIMNGSYITDAKSACVESKYAGVTFYRIALASYKGIRTPSQVTTPTAAPTAAPTNATAALSTASPAPQTASPTRGATTKPTPWTITKSALAAFYVVSLDRDR
jgi:hypothetical protein